MIFQFSTVHHYLLSAEIGNNDLIKISELAYQWKMSFNLEPTKQAQKVVFSQKSKKIGHPTICFNEAPVAHTNWKKHLGKYPDEKKVFFSI